MTERVMTQDDLVPHTIGGPKLAFAIFVLAMANFMAVLDITIVNVAVPHIAGGLAVSPSEGTWTITSYAVAEAIMVPLTGWLASRFGAVRVFVFAAFGFGLFSALCGIASSLGMLILARILQGLAGGPLMPMSQTLLMRVTPPKHTNIALGLWTMTTILAPIAGPVLGGTISDSIGWEWAFYINVPVAIACGLLSLRLFSGCETERVRRPIDAAGLGLLIVWIGALQIMLDKGQEDDWFNSTFILALAIVAVIGFIAFLIWELTDEHPIVDLKVFRHRGFMVASLAMAMTYGSYFGSVVLIPLWLQSNMNYTATLAGDMMAFNGVFGLMMAPIAAMLMNRLDARILLFTGISIISSTTLFRTTFASNIGWDNMILPQLAFGLGMPLFFVPLMGMTMASVNKDETASAAGLINFIRTTSAAVATAIVTTVWADKATANRVQLSGLLNNPDAALAHLQASGQTHEQARQSLDGLVQTQSVMIATNQMFLAIGCVLAVAALAVWLMPKPKGPVTPATAH